MTKRSLPLNSRNATFVAKIAPNLAALASVFQQSQAALSQNHLKSSPVAEHQAGRGGRARTALELHARYFDPDQDEAITPKQSLVGMTNLGVPWLLAAPLALIIHAFLGYLTRRRATLSISVPEIARGKHPFESGIFGPGGALDEAAFEALFAGPQTRAPRDRVTYGEFRRLLLKNGDPNKPFGPLGSLAARALSAAEVYTLFCLASDCKKELEGVSQRAMSRKNLRRFYEGRLFRVLARRRRVLRSRGAR